MEPRTGSIKGLDYEYFRCANCGDEVLTMRQLHELAEQERVSKAVRIAKWGSALAMRIPKQIAQTYHIRAGAQAVILPEKGGFKVVPQKR